MDITTPENSFGGSWAFLRAVVTQLSRKSSLFIKPEDEITAFRRSRHCPF
jgi:hypothetical protein